MFNKFEIFKNLELQNLTTNHSFWHLNGKITIMQGQHDRTTIGLHCANKKYDYYSSKITFNNGPCETTFGCEVYHDNCRNPTLKEYEDDTHTLEMGTWESSGTPEISKLDCKGQNTLPWGVLYTVEKFLKRRCRKWPHMSHSDICSTSYVRKKGRESNRQFDSQPLKVRNRPDASVCRKSATHRWKSIKERYKFSSDLTPIGGLSKELWAAKVPRVQTGTVSGQFRDSSLGVVGKSAIGM
jgi:hypothetical protein